MRHYYAAAAAALMPLFSTPPDTGFAQTPPAADKTMPVLCGVSRIALMNVRIIDGTGAPARVTKRYSLSTAAFTP
jgi:hypothetical protein